LVQNRVQSGGEGNYRKRFDKERNSKMITKLDKDVEGAVPPVPKALVFRNEGWPERLKNKRPASIALAMREEGLMGRYLGGRKFFRQREVSGAGQR